MAGTPTRISAPVGIRNGASMMPNLPADLAAITGLFDRIAFANGGTREIGGLWATERFSLIAEVTAEIVRFQTVNGRPVVDGVIDPNGGTLKRMNELAADSPPVPGGISATIVPAPQGRTEAVDRWISVAEVTSMSGLGTIRPATVATKYSRLLLRVEGSSIKWFGVVVGRSTENQLVGAVPHINFTPTPIQGGYADATYDSFDAWGQLWDDYTEIIGGQMAAAGANQVLVIPFYKTAQSNDLGQFLTNWRQVVSAVLATTFNSLNPLLLRDSFEFSSIVSSSFSNGYVAHQNFHGRAVDASEMTSVLFDLDGVAGGSNWRPAKGVIYQNRRSPAKANPVGQIWYVGERWSNEFMKLYGGFVTTHALCRNHLLYHAVWKHCR
jgi:hypothetical protein